LILRWVLFSVLLALLAGLIWRFPVLWELALVALIGGVYWIFFRITPRDSD
jgi:hypothetical protein